MNFKVALIALGLSTAMVGKISNKQVIDRHYTVTVGGYGNFLVTKGQYEAVKVGDEIPEYLKGLGK